MDLKSKVRLSTAVVLFGALVFLGITWWVNGRDDTWLYAMCALIVLSSFWYLKSPQGPDAR